MIHLKSARELDIMAAGGRILALTHEHLRPLVAPGVSTKALQEYRFAATQVGLSSDEMDAALSKLTRTIGEADAGAKTQAAAFAKLGILDDRGRRGYRYRQHSVSWR